MKAEHRKELQTNVLADRMGRLVERMKHRPRRRTFLYVVGVFLVLVVVFIVYQARQAAARERAEQWFKLEDGFKLYIDELANEHSDTNPGKAARFQYAWLLTWDFGLKRLGADPVQALDLLEKAQKYYKKLAEECAGDPVWEPEALYAIAVIEESRAIRRDERDKHIESALAMYRKLANDHKHSAHGKMAKKRAALLENKDKAREITDFYSDLEGRLDIDRRLREAEMIEKIKAKLKSSK